MLQHLGRAGGDAERGRDAARHGLGVPVLCTRDSFVEIRREGAASNTRVSCSSQVITSRRPRT